MNQANVSSMVKLVPKNQPDKEHRLIVLTYADCTVNPSAWLQIVAVHLRKAEEALAYYFHPIPYISPTAPGGSKWERNVPIPEELLKRGVTLFDNN
ncbi:hypothetical protein SeLEV6574_g01787 [Synchytrium endobioticum]|uniref:Uncharacterized protein n=1 Tax=Synchytrium endobioticum TaxID=286115 RepID=A0A507DB41_9FUNG|nr:hypothetical protein SeLEV6574_g01787 [Synchytrium endobioticum]